MSIAVPPRKSTIVRPKSNRLTLVRAGFAVLDRLAPHIAGTWALRIWCTLPRNSGRRKDNRPFPGRRADIGLPDGRNIAVEIWEPAGNTAPDAPAVFLAHGWGGWRGQLGGFVAPLVQAGRRVIAFDVVSHGDSSPSLIGRGRATAMDFIEAITAVAEHHGRPDGVIAHSLGCTTTAIALRDGLRARRVAFVAPGLDPVESTRHLEQVLGYGPRTRRHFFDRLSRLAGRPLNDFNVLSNSHDDLPPALVVHDRQDKETPYEDGVRLAEQWPEAELLSTDGLGHQRILIDEGVIKVVVDYVVN